ncbi:MAG: M4 family metallopeptidase [Acidobacteriota bacterium]
MKLFKLSLIVAALALLVFNVPATAADLGADVVSLGANGTPDFLRGDLGTLTAGISKRQAAEDFLAGFATERLGANGDEDFVAYDVLRDDIGQVHVRVQQFANGLPVVGGELIVHAIRNGNKVFAVNGQFVPAADLDVITTVQAPTALKQAAADAGLNELEQLSEAELVYVLTDTGSAHLAWQIKVQFLSEDGLEIDYLYADATTGAFVTRHPTIHRAKSWRTYDGNNGSSLPGSLRCTNGSCSGASTVIQTIDSYTSQSYDYYNARFGRDSYNGSGATINSTGHHRSNYVNAFWNGSQLVYGDGDGVNSGPLGNAFDVVAHELSHAVTQFTSGLIYQNESGALNEGMSDIFAAGAEVYKDGSINSGTWLVGEDTWTPGTAGDALRYMDNPTQDGSSYDYYPTRYTGSADNGGVHWNSGIANLAFHLLVEGGTHPRGVTTTNVSGIGMSKSEQIFYRAQTVYLTSGSSFSAARNATANAASDLYGSSSSEVDSVNDAWCAVGVGSCGGGGGPGGGTCPSGYNTYTGNLSAGQSGNTSPGSASGSFNGQLDGPSGADFDLYLQKESCSWWSCSYGNVAQGTTPSDDETVNYNGTSGNYRWRITAYSGNGSFTLCTNKP